jgi:N-acetylneuraminic acid mutarotase
MYRLKNVTAIVIGIFGLIIIMPSCKNSDTTTILGDWQVRSEFNGVARSEAVSFTVGDSAYLATGYDGTNRLADVWKYDPALNSWTQKADLPGTPRSSAVGFALNNKGYISTGYDGANSLNDLWQFDPAKNSWERKADFAGSPRYDAVAFAVMGKGYITTGYDGNYTKDFWQYNDSTDSWTEMISFTGFKRSGAVAFVYNNKAYVCTGNNNGVTSTVNDVMCYDPTAPAGSYWTAKRPITNVSTDTYDDLYTNITRTNAAAFVIGDTAYIATGNSGSAIATCWSYDITNDLWYSKTAFENSPREGAVGITVSNRGYIATGRSGNSPFDDIMEFKPWLAYVAND